MEMEAVADRFDKDGDGYIDYKEFVAALRPDRDVSLGFGPFSSFHNNVCLLANVTVMFR